MKQRQSLRCIWPFRRIVAAEFSDEWYEKLETIIFLGGKFSAKICRN
jgi:hypothetical protein